MFLAFDLRVAEKLVSLGVQEDRVVQDAVAFEHLLQLGPDWIVPLVAFRVGAGMNGQDEALRIFMVGKFSELNPTRVYSK